MRAGGAVCAAVGRCLLQAHRCSTATGSLLQGRLRVPGALHDAEEQWQSCGHCGYHGAMGRQWGITTPPGSRPGAKAVLPGVKSQINTEVVLSTERG